jgi:hypothetical protein
MRWSVLKLAGLVTLATFAACRDEPPNGPTSPRQTSATSQLPSSAAGFRTIDERYAELADEVPGFGGLFYDESGRLNVYGKDTARIRQSSGGLSSFLAGERPGVTDASRRAMVANMRLLKGQYDFRELLTLYRSVVVPAVVDMPGLTTSDIDETNNRIALTVATPDRIGAFEKRLVDVGVPPGLVSITVEPPVRLTSLLTDSLRPVPGGAALNR